MAPENRPADRPGTRPARDATRRIGTALALLAALSACQGTGAGTGPGGSASAPAVSRLFQDAPPDAAPGTCWAKTARPAVLETVTEQVLVQPATYDLEGRPLSAPLYATNTRQSILREREYSWFQRPCDSEMTEEFLSSLQRALAARGLYAGPVTGLMDARTQAAVRAFQKDDGIDSGMLSIQAARRLGLVAVPRP